MERKGATVSINKKGKVITLFSKKDIFPIKITFVDKDDNVTDYILVKTCKEKLILQKPFFKKSLS
jgi:hypothetical protein